MSWVGVITNAGSALLADCLQEQVGLVLDKVETGSGTTGSGTAAQIKAAMQAATALNDQEETGSVVESRRTDDGYMARLLVPPAETSYTLKEIGLFGKKQGSSTYVLFALYQDSSSAMVIPEAETFPDFAFTLSAPIAIDNDYDGTVEFEVDPDAYVPMSLFEEKVGDIEDTIADSIETLGDPTKNMTLFDAIYPVGSIYMSVAAVNPSTLFGGTWEAITGKFLLSTSSSHALGTTGGEETHTLTKSEMPSHTHTGPSHTHSVGSHTHTLSGHTHSIPSLSGTAASAGSHSHTIYGTSLVYQSGGTTAATYNNTGYTGTVPSGGAHTHSVSTNASTTGSGGSGNTGGSSSFNTGSAGTGNTGSAGSGSAHNNMPPFLAVNMWKRTA